MTACIGSRTETLRFICGIPDWQDESSTAPSPEALGSPLTASESQPDTLPVQQSEAVTEPPEVLSGHDRLLGWN